MKEIKGKFFVGKEAGKRGETCKQPILATADFIGNT
jgi:hypothetical protein